MCFESKNVNKVVLTCATHALLSTIPSHKNLVKPSDSVIPVVSTCPKIIIKSCEGQTGQKRSTLKEGPRTTGPSLLSLTFHLSQAGVPKAPQG